MEIFSSFGMAMLALAAIVVLPMLFLAIAGTIAAFLHIFPKSPRN